MYQITSEDSQIPGKVFLLSVADPRHNSLKQKPFYYAHDFVGQKFGLGTVRKAYLCILIIEVSSGILSWGHVPRASVLAVRLGSYLLLCAVSGGA